MKNMVDLRFVGHWKGCDDGKLNPDEINHWMMTRKKDGSFTVNFTTYYSNGHVAYFKEEGTWHVKGNTYYEHRFSDQLTDSYFFHFLNKDSIQFTETDTSSEPLYTFVDYKIVLH